MVRFLHSSDLHLGKRFGNYSEDLRGRLREARHGVLGRLAEAARREGATAILLAGDSFDTETPAEAVLRQALAEMGRHGDLSWIVLPGNHDSLQADQLWDGVRGAAPANVTLALANAPIALGAEAVVLPSPCTTRRPGRDLTDWMDGAASSEGVVRIGLAHGPIQTFSEDGVAGDVIAPDRAKRAGLDYLALGDWHGQIAVNERTYYSGSPEPDRFKHERPGQALLVSLAAPGAVPEVRGLDVGQFSWRTLTLDLLAGEDGVALLQGLLPGEARREALLRIVLRGRTGLAARSQFIAAIKAVAPEFAHLETDDGELVTQSEVGDLDRIDHAGALRVAADGLLEESSDASRSEEERDIAAAALVRLFSYCEEVGP
ncbi:metallophosphoesterase [Devosia sp. SD17-2]|uniref:metallophosphoesterase family protein n=1 Tax=Devosia sp. SD17-2 TaxID=2976459 RepID=UPI0023D7F563|nr:metallophosphoesterase [Devosia sp. SD17-2]WEJ34066.1 metallophosphoesterase [Devosia sp. SD17-2]